MKTAAIRSLRQKLAQDQCVYGLWVTLEAPSVTEMAVALGLDWVVIDAEHGHLDWKEIVEHLRATVRSDTVALVRIAELNQGLIKRALDIGADGVVIPWIESADQLRRAVAYATFPPEGTRGIGAERATCWGQCFVEHTGEANENVLVVPIIETVDAVKNARSLCQVDGVELLFFGPADLSSTAGFRGQWEGPGVAQQILGAKELVRAAGKHCGVVATSNPDLEQRRSQGFRMLGLGLDAGLLLRSLRESLRPLGRDRTISASFSLETAAAPAVLDCPPESMRPDRAEVMNPLGSGKFAELERGVRFECLVGSHNAARKLTTGLVTFAPGAHLAYHSHTFSEAITLLSGRAAVEVEGRRYLLEPLDNVVVPAGLAHYAQNVSGNEPAVFQIALASDNPARTLVPKFFSRRAMPADAQGLPGAERVNRFKLAKRGSAGPNTVFIDYFNQVFAKPFKWTYIGRPLKV